MATACLVEDVGAIARPASVVAEVPSGASAVATTVLGVDVERRGAGCLREGGVERVDDVEAGADVAGHDLAVIAGVGGRELVEGDDLEKHSASEGGNQGSTRCSFRSCAR